MGKCQLVRSILILLANLTEPFSRRVFYQSVGGGGLPGMKLASAVGAGVSLRRALINSL
jgi:hypothetical protein